MDEPKNRRTDHQGPKTPLRWGERWTLLLTSPTSGIVGQYGATWPGQPAHYERVNVYAEGAAKLDDIEQYRLQMAAIGTASFGYWKEGDTIHPDYDTMPLRDVAALYNKYAQLHEFREQVRRMVQLLKNREWAEDLALNGDAADLQSVITELIGARLTAPAPDAVDAALADAVVHGTGAFQVHPDGSTTHVDMKPDALYPDYATPAAADAPKP